MKKRSVAYRTLEPYRAALVCLYLAVAAWYLTWRLTTLNPDAMGFSLTLYGAELFGFFTTLLHLFMTWRLTERVSPAPETDRTVDVFIATIDEPVALVRQTALAALSMPYPHQVWILDDGRRPEMQRMAAELGCRYLARDTNEHAKAGNLNHALAHSAAEFIAIFDADHAPKREFLERTLGFFRDAKVAFVQTPQDFYNLDSYQHRRRKGRRHVWTEQSLFFRVIQRGKDYWNAAFFCGSCAIIRRSALEAVGGFGTGTVTEDLHTSIRLHKAGFRSVYLPETLALGVAPAQLQPFLRQRIRWGQGAMQVWRREGVLFARGLTLAQRLSYFASMITYFDGWQKMIFYTAPAVVLWMGVLPIRAVSAEFLTHFVPYIVLTFWTFQEVGRGYASMRIEHYNMARFAAFSWATLGLFKKNLRFRVTPKKLAGAGAVAFILLPQYAVLLLSAAAIPAGLFLNQLGRPELTVNTGWALVNAALAWSVVGFSLSRARYRRQHYRFPLPLDVRYTDGNGNTIAGRLEDISSSGFRLTLAGKPPFPVGNYLRGKIDLPDWIVPFEARVAAAIPGRHSARPRAIGCAFTRIARRDRDRLDGFLYGSDLQWRINGLEERAPTPLERLFAGAHRIAPHQAVAPSTAADVTFSPPANDLVHETAIPVYHARATARRVA